MAKTVLVIDDEPELVKLLDYNLTKAGYLTNTLTPFVGDANVHTPEFKAFLVNVEKAPAGVA